MIKGSFVLDATVSYDVVLRFVSFFSFALFTYYLICGQISTTCSATDISEPSLCTKCEWQLIWSCGRNKTLPPSKRYRLNKSFWIGHRDFTDPSLKAPLMTCNPQLPASRRFFIVHTWYFIIQNIHIGPIHRYYPLLSLTLFFRRPFKYGDFLKLHK